MDDLHDREDLNGLLKGRRGSLLSQCDVVKD
jgi:hypothetical protein